LPVARQPLSVTSVRNFSFFRQNRSTATATHGTVTSVAIGDTRSQQFRSVNVIEYETVPERRSQATTRTLPGIGRQSSAHARSQSLVRQNRSMGEVSVSVGTTAESRRSAPDAVRHETERRFQTTWLVSRQPMTSSFIPARGPSSARPNRLTGETASVGTAGADDATGYVPTFRGGRDPLQIDEQGYFWF
jgi:hypothetical protein